MWYLLDTLARPPLARHLQGWLDAQRRELLVLLRGPLDAAAHDRLLELLAAVEAAGWLLRELLTGPARTALKRALRRQRRMTARLARADAALLPGLRRHAGSRGDARTLGRLARGLAQQQAHAGEQSWCRRERRALEALLHRQARILDACDCVGDPAETRLRAALARLYAATSQALDRDLEAAGTQRRLGRLVRLEELLGFTRGPNCDAVGQRRLLFEALREARALRRLLDAPRLAQASPKDARRLRRLVASRRGELALRIADLAGSAMALRPAAYAAALPWQVFVGLCHAAPARLISTSGAD